MRFASATILVLAMGQFSTAGDLIVSGNHLNWASPADPSPPFVFRLVNHTGTTDELAGWQLSIEVIPAAAATGTVQVDSVAAPDAYLLAAGSSAIATPTSLPAARVESINDLSFFGAAVPPSPGGSLLQIGFVASSDASGQFDVAVIPGEFNSAWFSSDFQTRDFVNVPFNGPGPVTVGSVSIGDIGGAVVPEPSSLFIMAGVFGVAGGLHRMTQRRAHRHRRRA